MNEIDKEAVGRRIKAIRLDLGESGETFGKRFDPIANRGLVSGWETGRYLPNNERLKLIAEIGGYDVEELLYGTIEEYIATQIRKDSEGHRLSEEQYNRVFEAVLSALEGAEKWMGVISYSYIDGVVHFSILDEILPIHEAPQPSDRSFDDTIDYYEWLVMRVQGLVEEFEEIAKDVKQDKLTKGLTHLKVASEKISAIE